MCVLKHTLLVGAGCHWQHWGARQSIARSSAAVGVADRSTAARLHLHRLPANTSAQLRSSHYATRVDNSLESLTLSTTSSSLRRRFNAGEADRSDASERSHPSVARSYARRAHTGSRWTSHATSCCARESADWQLTSGLPLPSPKI